MHTHTLSNHLYRRSMCVNNQRDKKQAGGRKLPLSDCNPRINFRRNRVFRQATVPSGHRPCHVYHTSTFPGESLLRVPGLLLLPSKHLLIHHMITKWFAIETPRVSSLRPLASCRRWLFTHMDRRYKWFDTHTYTCTCMTHPALRRIRQLPWQPPVYVYEQIKDVWGLSYRYCRQLSCMVASCLATYSVCIHTCVCVYVC